MFASLSFDVTRCFEILLIRPISNFLLLIRNRQNECMNVIAILAFHSESIITIMTATCVCVVHISSNWNFSCVYIVYRLPF